jgi:CheY-like chemotaxis protein
MFKVYLPAIEACSMMPKAPERPNVAASAHGNETILVAEDEPQLREVIVEVLRNRGYSVIAADNGPAAVQIAEKHRGGIDLVLTDMVMPGMTGVEVARRVRELSGRAKILFMSGYSAEVIENAGKADNGDDFLQKPFSPNALVARVRAVLDNGYR